MPSHYNYAYDSLTGTYNFTTKNCIIYRVAFIADSTFSTISGQHIPNIFQLIIEKATNELEPYDSAVLRTVEHIIDGFFQKIENSLVYICSDENDKAQIRHIIFDRWYKKSPFKSSVIKIDNVIHINTGELGIHKIYTLLCFIKTILTLNSYWTYTAKLKRY